MSEQTTDELNPKQTDQLETPVIEIESIRGGEGVTSTEPPLPEEEPHTSQYATVPLAPETPVVIRREFHFNYWLLVAALLLLILAGEHISPLISSIQTTYFHHQAKVTLFTTTKSMSTTYSFLAVTGTADPSQQQVPSRILTFTTPTQTVKITTTGIGHTPPVQASGEIQFYNEAPYSQTVQAGTVLTGNRSVQIVTDETVTVSAGNPPNSYGQAATTAHSIQAGAVGNIPPLDINSLCCLSGIYAKNSSSFIGGKDPQAYPMVSKDDVKNAARQLSDSLDPLARQTVSNQIAPTEQVLTPMKCSDTTVATPKVGEQAKTAQITVSQTCAEQVFNYTHLQTLTREAFLKDAQNKAGSHFTPKGDVTVRLEKTALLDSRHNTYKLFVRAASTLLFHLTASQLRTLTDQIAGKSLIQARTQLLQMQGIEGAYIQPLDKSQTLPADPEQIQIIVS